MAQPLRIFISYAHIDEPFKERLVSYLTFLKRKGLVEIWHDQHIDGGDDWRAAIQGAMNDCTLALMLVSDAFLASEFIQSHELHHLLGRHENDGIRVVPIILRPCPWELEVIGKLQALPHLGTPIVKFSEDNGDRDQAWTDISRKIAVWSGIDAEPVQPSPPPQGVAAGKEQPPVNAAPVPSNPQEEAPKAILHGLASLLHGAATWLGGTKAQPVQPVPPPPVNPVVAVNPYNPWNEALPPRFFGRADLLHRLEAALDGQRSMSLVGDWRIGKTSLLRTWQQMAEARGRTVRFVSGQGAEAVSCAAFVKAVSGKEVAQSAHPEADADAAADVLAQWAQEVAPAGLPPLILIDEADAMLPRLPARFFERLRGMLGTVCLVIASRREIDHIYQDAGRTSPFANQLEMQRLGLLEAEAAEQLIALGAEVLSAEDRELMRTWAGRHPYYLALLGRHLWDARRHGKDSEEALELFKDEASARLRELWKVLGEHDRQGLRDLLQGQAPDGMSLKRRGLADAGQLFGKVLETWLKNPQ